MRSTQQKKPRARVTRPVATSRSHHSPEPRLSTAPDRGNVVIYSRVSTQRQGRSGLGLDAQRAAVNAYLNGGRWNIKAEFVEVESGTGKAARPELQKAIAAAKLYDAVLVIAKLDRLSRSVKLLEDLRAAGVKFVAADMPDANDLTITIMVAVGQHEAKLISDRTKAALAEARRRGTKLGGIRPGQKITLQAQAAGRASSIRRAEEEANKLRPRIEDLRADGITTLQGIADALTKDGIATPTASAARKLAEKGIAPQRRPAERWSAMQVSRLLKRLG